MFPPNPLKQESAARSIYDDQACHSCEDYAALRAAWLELEDDKPEDDKPVGQRTIYLEIWQHVHSCPDCQHWARLAQADVDAFKGIAIELPVIPAMIGVEA